MSTSLDPWEGVSDGTLTDLSDEEEVLQTRPAPRRSPPKAPKPGMLRPKRAPAEPLASLYAPKRPRTRSSFPLGKEHESNWRLYESVPSHSQQAPQATATSSTPALPIALARPSLRPRTRSSVGIVVEAKQASPTPPEIKLSPSKISRPPLGRRISTRSQGPIAEVEVEPAPPAPQAEPLATSSASNSASSKGPEGECSGRLATAFLAPTGPSPSAPEPPPHPAKSSSSPAQLDPPLPTPPTTPVEDVEASSSPTPVSETPAATPPLSHYERLRKEIAARAKKTAELGTVPAKRASQPSRKLQESTEDQAPVIAPRPSPRPPPFPSPPSSSAPATATFSSSASHLSLAMASLSQYAQEQVASGNFSSLLSDLPPLPNPAPSAAKKSSAPKKVIKAAKEYVADKTGWVEPEKDLEMIGGFPPIWCLGRQELCESLPYFKSYQGGHYDLGEICHGYLLDAFGSPLDRMEANGRIIISHGGGCSEGTGEDYRLKEDQRRDNVRVRALLNCQRTNTPVVLLAGSKYPHFAYLETIGVRYAVLGYYFVRSVWVEAEPIAESSNYHTRFKFAFEWVPSQGVPWFESVIGEWPKEQQLEHPVVPEDRLQTDEVYCPVCNSWSPDVFVEPITCYDERCSAFFKLPSGRRAFPSELKYRDSFLLPLTPSAWPTSVPALISPPSLQDLALHTADYSRASWRGFWCSRCGRASSRSDWRALTCDGCGTSVATSASIYEDATSLQGHRKRVAPVVAAGVQMRPFLGVEGWAGWTIEVGADARVHQLWPVGATEKEDRLFREYQTVELFKRNTLSTHRLPGSYLCSQFSFNAGAEYNHVVNVETFPFDRPLGSSADPSAIPVEGEQRAPSCVREACEHVSAIASLACTNAAATGTVFNEVLSVAYMEGGKMSFHDDGEQGLGPIVASLSLGADAVMNFRRKPPKKSRAKGAVDDLRAKRETPAELAMIKLHLRHGDVMIMEGEEVQRTIDHMVEPVDGLRFAATARFIGPQHKTRIAVPASRIRAAVCPPGLRVGPPPPPHLLRTPPSEDACSSQQPKPKSLKRSKLVPKRRPPVKLAATTSSETARGSPGQASTLRRIVPYPSFPPPPAPATARPHLTSAPHLPISYSLPPSPRSTFAPPPRPRSTPPLFAAERPGVSTSTLASLELARRIMAPPLRPTSQLLPTPQQSYYQPQQVLYHPAAFSPSQYPLPSMRSLPPTPAFQRPPPPPTFSAPTSPSFGARSHARAPSRSSRPYGTVGASVAALDVELERVRMKAAAAVGLGVTM